MTHIPETGAEKWSRFMVSGGCVMGIRLHWIQCTWLLHSACEEVDPYLTGESAIHYRLTLWVKNTNAVSSW